MTEIDRDNEQFNNGVTHTVDLLAKVIGATGWVAGDGSEDYDEDLGQTLLNILAAKGLYDQDTGRYAALSLQDHATEARRLVDEQAKDEGLWFHAQTCAEAYLQAALRKLHAAVEGQK